VKRNVLHQEMAAAYRRLLCSNVGWIITVGFS
jgi:hypothetical protein